MKRERERKQKVAVAEMNTMVCPFFKEDRKAFKAD